MVCPPDIVGCKSVRGSIELPLSVLALRFSDGFLHCGAKFLDSERQSLIVLTGPRGLVPHCRQLVGSVVDRGVFVNISGPMIVYFGLGKFDAALDLMTFRCFNFRNCSRGFPVTAGDSLGVPTSICSIYLLLLFNVAVLIFIAIDVMPVGAFVLGLTAQGIGVIVDVLPAFLAFGAISP
jgi:hypothetical protein